MSEARWRRTPSGVTIHRSDCARQGRTYPWNWAKNRPTEHLIWAARRFQYRFCKVCSPDEQRQVSGTE